ncbi:unnamed protein product, partial [Rotaria sp. Silwood1]
MEMQSLDSPPPSPEIRQSKKQ